MTRLKNLAQAQALAAGLPQIILAAERLAFTAAPGLHGRRRTGAGDDFWQYRIWQNGDDTRRIDWRRSAQSDSLFLREREWDTQSHITLALDDTATLDFSGTKSGPTKRDRAILLVLALAAILLRAGERVSLAGCTPPLAGPRALSNLAAALTSGGASAVDLKSRRISFGDFLQPDPKFLGPAGGAVMQILDPAECDFPYRGRIIFEGFAGEPPLETDDAAQWAAAYRTRIAAQRDAVAGAAMQAGQVPLFHRTDHPPALALAALYQALLRA